jgi:hypothetical protein
MSKSHSRRLSQPVRLWLLASMVLSLAAPWAAPPAAALAPEPLPAAQAPELVYETVYNPGFLDSGQDIAVDGAGNAYVLAWSYHSETLNDINVSKLGPKGAVLWSVDIMGQSLDIGFGIALNGAGDVYIAGYTDSADFPLVDPLQDTLTGFRDAFVTKLSAQDGSILYSTFLGGNYVDEAHDIAIGPTGEIYLVGLTESSDFPTANPIQGALNGPPYQYSDAFITKLSADGGAILYSTYLGGTRDDQGISIALDGSNRIYITGRTKSDDFPTAIPIQPAYAGTWDAFVTRITADGSALEYSTYLGGDDWDLVYRIAVDAAGQAFVSGRTQSYGFPTTPGAFQEQFVGGDCSQPPEYRYCYDAFVTKVAADGSAWEYSTFLAGSQDDEARGIAVDGSGNAYLVGYTFSSDFPGAPGTGIYLSKLNATGSDLLYTVVKWSGSLNAGHGITLDGADNIYITGALNVPADVYVARLSEAAPPPENTTHVADIRLKVRDNGRRYVLQALVMVKGQDGAAVGGAEVMAEITLPSGSSTVESSVTDARGRARFRGRSNAGGTWQVCVTGIVKAGFTYDPGRNSETCDSIVFP